MDTAPNAEPTLAPRWTALPKVERRILGVLVEKAKTTPDQYPLSLNALTNGCNQKSNRSPQMNLAPDDVEDAIDALRERGAVGEVQGGGRVARFRHYLKDWLGVDGTELAVMAELMLRGTQTLGELRGRTARMAAGQLPDLSALRPVMQTLIDKGLVIALTPEGRGQIVTHALYEAAEMDRVRREAGSAVAPSVQEPPARPAAPTATPPPSATTIAESVSPSTAAVMESTDGGTVAQLRQEVATLREEVARLRKEIDDIWANIR